MYIQLPACKASRSSFCFKRASACSSLRATSCLAWLVSSSCSAVLCSEVTRANSCILDNFNSACTALCCLRASEVCCSNDCLSFAICWLYWLFKVANSSACKALVDLYCYRERCQNIIHTHRHTQQPINHSTKAN